MPLVRRSVAAAASLIEAGALAEHLVDQFVHRMGYHPSPSEVKSWDLSIRVLVGDLQDAGLDAVEMLLEYRLPLNSKRADVVLCGVHPRTGEESYVVVELKQWNTAIPVDGTDDVIFSESFKQPRLHPVEQVRAYCEYIADMVGMLNGEGDKLAGVAYLHNAVDEAVAGLFLMEPSQHGQLFTSSRRQEFLKFLTSRLAPQSGADAADALKNSAVKPSKQLLAVAADEVQRREQFTLLDEQQVAYSLVMRAVDRAYGANTKQVVIITGGPGSGKSVIALSLMGELARRGRTVMHATGSSAFTSTLRKVAAARAPKVRKLFTYYNQFIDAEKNSLDVLINDEAHRVKETSTNRYTPASKRTGRPQVEELIDVARVPVFLLDEYQVVRPGERGTVSEIQGAADRMGCEVVTVDLDGQFRCGGSRLYESWVLNLLGLEGNGPIEWTGDDGFVLETVESPSELEAALSTLIGDGYSSRISAGYCWKWDQKPKADFLYPDVKIGDWARPWNNPKDSKHGNAPGRPYWATDPAGFGQVGCIYTAQGFEYDYSGVIFGPDLVWRDGGWVARPEHSRDNQVRNAPIPEFERAIKNTYKVLLTRGMRGTYLYSTDSETRALFDRLINSAGE
ncbi:DUF2075 domain-containing protein [Dietzia maris]|uniref:DUF2075 domain-containing protein n=1 Tax=Dietzia maris TaxID=37915 RepID=UPI002FDF4966